MAGQRDLVARGKDSSTHWSGPPSRLKPLFMMIELAEVDGLCEREADDDYMAATIIKYQYIVSLV
jgi:hypothetical protein